MIPDGSLFPLVIPAERLVATVVFVVVYGFRLAFQAFLLRRRDKTGERGDWGELLLVVVPKNILVLVVPYLLLTTTPFTSIFLLGWIVFLLGIAIRLVALKQLGPMYSLNVDIRNDHKLVEVGLFAWIRHPLYFAYVLDTLGIVIFLQEVIIALVLVPITVGIIIRTRTEEKSLRKAFGAGYDQYSERVAGFNPVATYWRTRRGRGGVTGLRK